MKFFLGLSFLFFSFNSFSIPCDCKIFVGPPLIGSLHEGYKVLKVLEVEEFSVYSKRNFQKCRVSCVNEFGEYLGKNKLDQLLRDHTVQLLSEKKIGFSCVNQLNLKYPIKVKAELGSKNLGSIEDFIEVINYENRCF